MNRPLKFRAWNTQARVMYFDVQDCYDYMSGHGRSASSDFVPATYFGELLRDDEWIVMQWTGLVDKHGQDIYEGDILEDNEYPEEGVDQAVVIWDSEREGWNTQGWGSRIEDGAYEVIGNILENPELLEAA